MKTKLYHFTCIENVDSILSQGIKPHKAKGLMKKSDGLVYLTDSHKYIKIMAEEIANLSNYVVITVNIDGLELTPIWWKGKGHREWTYKGTISKDRILQVKIITKQL